MSEVKIILIQKVYKRTIKDKRILPALTTFEIIIIKALLIIIIIIIIIINWTCIVLFSHSNRFTEETYN